MGSRLPEAPRAVGGWQGSGSSETPLRGRPEQRRQTPRSPAWERHQPAPQQEKKKKKQGKIIPRPPELHFTHLDGGFFPL